MVDLINLEKCVNLDHWEENMKRSILGLLVLFMVFGLAACQKAEVKELVGNYANGSFSDYSYDGAVMGKTYATIALHIYSDGNYEMTTTELVNMFDMVGGTTTITVYGTYTKADTVDGFAELTLEAPIRVLYASYSNLGGFVFGYDTDKDESYIIPGGDDQSMTKEEFLNALGYSVSKTVYVVLDSSNNETAHFEFTK